MPLPRHRLAAVFLCLLLAPVLAMASAEKEESAARGFAYLALTPPFVVSFASSGKVGYLRAEVSLRLAAAAVPAATQHMPAIRHELIMLLSRQEPEALAAVDKREVLRLASLEMVRKLLADSAATAPADVQDLLFTAFYTQR